MWTLHTVAQAWISVPLEKAVSGAVQRTRARLESNIEANSTWYWKWTAVLQTPANTHTVWRFCHAHPTKLNHWASALISIICICVSGTSGKNIQLGNFKEFLMIEIIMIVHLTRTGNQLIFNYNRWSSNQSIEQLIPFITSIHKFILMEGKYLHLTTTKPWHWRLWINMYLVIYLNIVFD